MNWHAISAEDALRAQSSSEIGLEQKEAAKRLQKFGENILVQEKKRSVLLIFFNQFKNFLTLLLIAAFIISIFTQPLLNSIVLLAVILVNIFMGFGLEHKAEKTLEGLKKIFIRRTVVRREEKEMIIDVRELVPGDIVILNPGDLIGADLRILRYNNLKIDESALTGESVPSRKTNKTIDVAKGIIDRENIAFAGTVVVDGTGEGLVVETSQNTELGKIAKTVQTPQLKTPLQKRLDSLGKILILISLVAALLTFVIGVLRGVNILELFNFTVALLVSIVPESLPTIVILALALGVIRMAKKRAIIRRLPAVETLSSVNVICTDKTGTLTKNQMTVKLVWVEGREVFKIPGAGYSPEPKIELNDEKIIKIAEISYLCNNASLNLKSKNKEWQVVGDPTEGALKVFAEKASMHEKLVEIKRIEEIPFQEKRKRMSVVVSQKDGLYVYMKGAPEVILEHCQIDEPRKEKIIKKAYALAKDGYRLLGFAYKKLNHDGDIKSLTEQEIESNLEFLGITGLIDPPAKNVKAAIDDCLTAGIKVIVISGDHLLTTLSVARTLGLKNNQDQLVSNKNAMIGDELRQMSFSKLKKKIKDIFVFARTSPLQKKKILAALKSEGNLVAMTGDGINDAPALRRADISIAMGRRGQEVSKEVSDIVLIDDNFATIKNAVLNARSIYDNIKKFLTFLLSGNFDELMLVVLAFIFNLPLPFTALQILWINLITDSFPALALAFEKPNRQVMTEPPRDRRQSMIRGVIVYALMIGVLATIIGFIFFLGYLPGGEAKARTMVFTLSVFYELTIVFSIRRNLPFWQKKGLGFFSNYYLLLAVVLSIVLQLLAVYSPLASAMGTVGLLFIDWVFIILSCLAAFLLLEVIKSVTLRRKGIK